MNIMEFFRETASSYAGDIDFVIIVVGILGGFWLLLSEGVFFYFIFKFRARKGQKAQYIAGETHAETKLVHWAHYVVIACDIVIIFFAIRVWYHVKQELPAADATIEIVGQQWAWRFRHPGPDGLINTDDDVETVDELHLKVDTTYHFKLKAHDVLHDFSVPVFRIKQDAIPGRVITGWFKPTKTGKFDIQCAEMCGIGHGIMGATLYVDTASNHDNWLATKAGG